MVSPYLTAIILSSQSSGDTGKAYCFFHGRHCWVEDECIVKQRNYAAMGSRVNAQSNGASVRQGTGVKNSQYARDLFEGSIIFD